ncbi:prepilin peptidase [Halopseudomonas bauzanensis]|uniref:prepilin peptidase n=1 Tax=Halopseudomonas bauzanensis TaxID=653930 RepID=UPI0035260F13
MPAGLLVWALCCAVQDARHRRISNRLTLGLGAVALSFLVLTGYSFTGAAPGAVILGLLLALLLSLPGYIGGRMGAGDVKLLAALALASSPLHVLGTVAGAAVTMLVWALGAPFIWQRLPTRAQRQLIQLEPGQTKGLAYAPFFLCGLLLSLLILSQALGPG